MVRPTSRSLEPAVPAPPPIDVEAIEQRIRTAILDQEAKWAISLETRLQENEAAHRAALVAAQADLASRLGALETRPALDPAEVSRRVDEQVKAAVGPTSAALVGAQGELASRLGALETRPALDPAEVSRRVDEQVKAAVATTSAALGAAASQAAGEAWSTKFTSELQQAIQEFDARAAKSEEELRAALVAQLDVELSESKEQGTALREEIEARVRKIIDEKGSDTSGRLTREVHDLEQRLSVLVEGRAKDLEGRLGGASTTQKEKLAAIADERVARAEQRGALEREARLTEVTESQTEALAGLQVRMQAYVEGKLREGLEKDKDQYIALLARLKIDTEQALARTVDAGHLDTLLNERVTDLLERAHADQSKAVAAAVAHSEGRIRAAQQELLTRLHHLETTVPAHAVDVSHIERTVRRELDDFDRRLKVVHDHILPMVRQTWLKVSSQEFGGNVRDLRQSLEKEIQRLEASMVAENDQLRERLETAVAQHGRIWLNLIQQISRDEGALSIAPRGRGRGMHRAARPIVSPPAPSSDGSFPPEASPAARRSSPPPVEARGDPAAGDPSERRRLRRPAQ